MQRVVRAYLHTFAATDAALKEVRLIHGSWRSQETLVVFDTETRVDPQQRNDCCAGGQPGDCFSALQVRPLDRSRGRGEEPESDPTLGTVRDAVETKVTFGFAPMGARRRVVTALTVEQATAAVVAVDGLLLQAENR